MEKVDRIDRLKVVMENINKYKDNESNLVKVEFLIKDEIESEKLGENHNAYIESLQGLLNYEVFKCNLSKKKVNKSLIKDDYEYLINRFSRIAESMLRHSL